MIHQRVENGTAGWYVLSCLRGAVLACLPVLAATGCNSFGSGKLVRELRNENERLLTEFRAERDRRAQTEKSLRTVESRLAESEKMLASQYRSSQAPLVSQRQHSASSGGARQPPFASALSGAPGSIPPDPDDGAGLRWQRRITAQ